MVARHTIKSFVVPFLVCAALVTPFLVLQSINRRTLDEAFPFVLFTFMSLHALLIVQVLRPALRRLWAERSLGALKPRYWAGVLLGLVLVFAYVDVVIDQLPCFLGVPNCD